jgi:serine phosphatase RsbU (regulator of sigma subunit)
MSLRLRLIVAFFLLSVVPLAAVTFYSYNSNERALQVAAQHETEMLTGELTQRMQVVTNQISERVEHLMDMPVTTTATATGTTGQTQTSRPRTVVARSTPAKSGSTPAKSASTPAAQASAPTAPVAPSAPVVPDAQAIEAQVAASLGEVAMLLNNVEVRGMGRYGRGGAPPSPGVASPGTPPPGGLQAPSAPSAPGEPPGGAEPRRPFPEDRSALFVGRGRGNAVTPPEAVSPDTPAREGEGRRGMRPSRRPDAGAPSGVTALPGPPDEANPDLSHLKIDLAPIRRDLFRQMAPNGSFEQMTPEERARIGREVNQRLLGIVQGIQLSAQEIQKKADAQRDAASAAAATGRATGRAALPETPGAGVVPAVPTPPAVAAPPPVAPPAAQRAPAAPATPASSSPQPAQAPKPMTKKAALTGTSLAVKMERNGQVVQQVNAEINLPNLLATVFASTRRDSGEIPFAVGKDGHLYTPTEADRARLAPLDVVHDTTGTTRKDNWIVVTAPDQSGAGLRFGIARPVGNLLNDLRRTTARNAGFGLLFIAVALVGIVPLSGRLTRNLSSLTEGVSRIAKGDYAARVPVKSRDEIGRLAAAFNRMATDVEQHQRSAVEQERIRRELELGRLIQSEMLPHAPLQLGLTEVKGVSVPAREVGGDFFNYFQLESGLVALLVGDVSGKGVGAALLMANIQASLRTRFALGQELSAIAEAIDRDIEANSPGPVYATLFMAILDPKTRHMRYVNAGHNPQLAVRADGRLEKMSSTGLPVGMLAGHGYSEREVQLAAGDLLFFYTDGCVEMENEAGDMFGSDRLESLVAQSARGTADEVVARVEEAITTFRGHRELFDDATMMAVTVG